MRSPLGDQSHPVVLFNRQNHGLEDIHVPTLADAKPDRIQGFPDDSSAQRDALFAGGELQNDGLPQPYCVGAFHLWMTPLYGKSGRQGFWQGHSEVEMVQRLHLFSMKVLLPDATQMVSPRNRGTWVPPGWCLGFIARC